MTEERRYRDEEVEAILDRAFDEPRGSARHALDNGRGLTLAELEEIGREVGIAPGRIAAAARSLDAPVVAVPRGTLAGLPISVGRIVDLPRAPTDHEWELLVTEIRRTFAAKGRLSSHGSLREWTNGNLHVYVEPTETGHRLRMGTLKGNALALSRVGAFGLAATAVLAVVLGVMGVLGERAAGIVVLTMMFGGFLGGSLLPLRGWAREREEQMDAIAGRALALLSREAGPER